MATIRKRGQRWHVQVRRKGWGSVTRSFLRKADAKTWAREVELEADRRGLPADRKVLERLTLADVLCRYREEVVPRKRGAANETLAINAFLRHELASAPIAELRPADVAAYRDERLRTVKPTSFSRELDILRHALEVARKDWSLPLVANPFAAISKPKKADARSRRLQQGEWARLEEACRQCRSPYLLLMVELAVETGMRRGEMLKAQWQHVDLGNRTLHIPLAKNGSARTIPLTPRALAIIERLKALSGQRQLVIPMTLDAMKMAWKRAIRRAGLSDFRFHDLRHEAVSRFFEYGLSVPEVALISGHRDPRMLSRYTHLRPENVAEKLAKAAGTIKGHYA
jgi:integrase